MNNKSEISKNITIAIPAHNEEKTIYRSIKSIQEQNLDIPYEIIVINNASTDNTSEVVNKMGIKVINEPQKGLYFARSAALKYAQTEYLIYIDADTILSKNWIKKVFTYLQDHPDTVAASSNYYFPDANIYFKPIHIITQFVLGPLVLFLFRLFGRPDFFVGTAFIVRTKILKEVGGFDKNFPFYGEDLALAYRLAKKGKIKFFLTLLIQSSARRYSRLGLIKTHFLYYILAFYFFIGRVDKAAKFSQKYS